MPSPADMCFRCQHDISPQATSEPSTDIASAVRAILDQPTTEIVDGWTHDDVLPDESSIAFDFDLDVVSRRL